MIHNYQLQGMTCKGCLRNIHTALSEIDGVIDVDIAFEESIATIKMEEHIPLEVLESAVQKKNTKYHIHPDKGDGLITRTFPVNGMTCNGCKAHVEKTLSSVEGVQSVSVDLEKAEATIDMKPEIPIEKFQKVLEKDGGTYSIFKAGQRPNVNKEKQEKPKGKGTGTFYCPMHCEGDKTYDEPGDCPVCGMDLVEEVSLSTTNKQQWTCPMHPEVVKDEAGACPICGMDLVPMQPDLSAEEKTYKSLLKKFWIATVFTVPIFIIAMSEMLNNNPLYDLSLIHI